MSTHRKRRHCRRLPPEHVPRGQHHEERGHLKPRALDWRYLRGGNGTATTVSIQRLADELDTVTIPVVMDEPDHVLWCRVGVSEAIKASRGSRQLIGVPNFLVFSEWPGIFCDDVFFGAGDDTVAECLPNPQGKAVCQQSPHFGATSLQAACVDHPSARMRSSTKQTPRSLA